MVFFCLYCIEKKDKEQVTLFSGLVVHLVQTTMAGVELCEEEIAPVGGRLLYVFRAGRASTPADHDGTSPPL